MDYQVIVIGAGVSGIGVGLALKQAGIDDFVILEKGDRPGGTWRDNVYPGVACDHPAILYEYAFEPNPEWSRMYAPGHEIQAYVLRCIDKYDLTSHLSTSVEVVGMRFDEARDVWLVDTSRGPLAARFVVVAHGTLAIPSYPNFPGLDAFQGRVCHTARWDLDGQLKRKRVAVIGTGASALQAVPLIADVASRLTVFQRTPIWVLPKPDFPFPPWLRRVFRRFPVTQQALRRVVHDGFEKFSTYAYLEYTEHQGVMRMLERIARWHLRHQVKDPSLRERLQPHYGFGCKRPSWSNRYFTAFTREHVDLVTDGIDEITARGVRTAEGVEVELDVIVLATGFKVFQPDSAPPFEVVGVGGQGLRGYWQEHRLQAYEGTSVPGFPNLFLVPGPYAITTTSHFDMVSAGAWHARRVIRAALERGATRVSVRPEANDAYLADVLERHRRGVFLGPGCTGVNSYYFDRNGDVPFIRPHSGRHTLWSGENFPLDDYEYTSAGVRHDAAASVGPSSGEE